MVIVTGVWKLSGHIFEYVKNLAAWQTDRARNENAVVRGKADSQNKKIKKPSILTINAVPVAGKNTDHIL